MPNPIPPLTPGRQAEVDQFLSGCSDLLDNYIKAIEVDMNRHAVKHGAMEEGRAVFDIARMLKKDIPANMLAGVTAVAIVRGIARKRQGKG